MSGASSQPLQTTALRVLVVEDQPANRALLAAFLSPLAVELTMAEHGADGVEIFKTASFDAVLMDVRMPVMDGLTAVRALRRIERERGDRQGVPIAMLTSETSAETRRTALATGADEYFHKPIDPSQILGFIGAAGTRRMDLCEKAC